MVQTKLTESSKKEKTVAEELAKKQREISISEFFTKNRHLLGFDNSRKALLTTIKEAVDNSLDACEEMRILPDLIVEANPQKQEDRFQIIVEDNGPGIVKEQIPRIFAKLLYGSKFFKLSQSLTGDQPVIIKKDGKINIINIGRLIDSSLKAEGEIKCNNLEVPCFDWGNYKYAFKKVSHLIKHKRRNEIYKITTTYGKQIKVTGCHSVFTINKNTLKVEQIEARKLKIGDAIIAPKRLEINDNKDEVNILDHIDESYAKKHYWYLYTDRSVVLKIFSDAKIIHKTLPGDKSRKYYRFTRKERSIDILDDSYKQYVKKGFIPVWIIKFLNKDVDEGIIRSYYHGKKCDFPVILCLTPNLMRFIGLFVAEGHTDKRQIGFTFSRNERELVRLVCDVGHILGVSYTIEERPQKNCVRVKLFGGLLSYLFREWFGHGAKNKKLPDFIFTASKELRQDCLDYLYVGDGHYESGKNKLQLTTVSKKLATQVTYLWLIQGVISAFSKRKSEGLGKKPTIAYGVLIQGNDINKSNYYNTNSPTKRKTHDLSLRLISKMLGGNITNEALYNLEALKELNPKEICEKEDLGKLFRTNKIGYRLYHMTTGGYLARNKDGTYCVTEKTQQLCEEIKNLQTLLESDLIFLRVKSIRITNNGNEYVYDISVPNSENFVGGMGALACHNSRGQQGIGISAAAMYGQMTTGKPIKITSKIGPKKQAHYFELLIDTKTNEPQILKEEVVEWDKDHGTRIDLEIEARYQKGKGSIDDYLKQTAIANPHVHIYYKTPEGEKVEFPRATKELPKEPKEIKPHPYGIELGILIKMLQETRSSTLQGFLQSDFCRISSKVAKDICEKAKLYEKARPARIARQEAENLMQALKSTKIMNPPTNCVTPIGEENLTRGLKKEVDAEFYAATTRPPAVYRGSPFQIEVGVAYGGTLPADDLVRVIRFANRVPLLYQQSACAITKSIIQTMWKNYGLSQSRGALPSGPAMLMIHMASVWVPFTSESKEAVASYPEIMKEIKLALQECGRKLASHIRHVKKTEHEKQRKKIFEMYIKEVANSLHNLTGDAKGQIEDDLLKIAQKRTLGEQQ